MNHEWNCNCEECCRARGGRICPACGAMEENCLFGRVEMASNRAKLKLSADPKYMVPPYTQPEELN